MVEQTTHVDPSSDRRMILGEHDAIVAVVPERTDGPGWANLVIWVYVQDGDGKIRRESMQPDEWRASRELLTIAHIGALVALQLKLAIEELVEE